MAISAEIKQKIDNNCVRVEVSGKKVPTRYFRVPEDKADIFCEQYKKNDTRTGYLTGAITVGAVLAVCATINALMQKAAPVVKRSIGIGAGIITAIGSLWATAPLVVKREDKLLNQFGANEINFERTKFPI